MSTILATSISWRVQVTFWWDDARFVLDQHVEIDFYSASSLTLQSADRYVTPLDTLFWFRVNQSLLLLLRASCLAERQQMTTDMELLTIWEHLGSPPVLVGSVLLIFLVFCVEFLFFVFVLCLVYPMLPVSLDCPFLITPSVFSNVYFQLKTLEPVIPHSRLITGLVTVLSVLRLFGFWLPLWYLQSLLVVFGFSYIMEDSKVPGEKLR
jgi:hypothetical protein